jgi:glucose/arabinose dehydrogenase
VVEFSAQKGLEVWGDPRLLRVALENLIGNAWKFTEKEPEARRTLLETFTGDAPVYSLGHRNVQGIAWDTDGRMWASEFGQNEVDEINRIEPGANYGWPDVEGEGDTDGGRYTNPEHTWPVSDASPSGITVAHGTVYMAALRGQRLWAMDITDDGTLDQPTAMFENDYGRLRTVATAPDGSLWLTTSNTDGRGNIRDGDDRIIRFPATDT